MVRRMVRRTSIHIDDEQLAEVQRVLGTKGLRETVERAFDEVIKTELRRQLAERIVTGQGFDRGPEILEETRAPRRFSG